MARGKRWSQEEDKLLEDMVKQGLSVEEIVKGGKFLGRTHAAIAKQIERLYIVRRKGKIIVRQISPVDVLSLEEVLRRFSSAFQKICDVDEVSKLELERFRIVFSAARDYGPILAGFERLRNVEEEIADLRKMVEEVKAQVSARNPEA